MNLEKNPKLDRSPRNLGDDYWRLFQSIRLRLNDIHAFRMELGETWNRLQMEVFSFKFRMLIEEISLFLRSALTERGQLSRRQVNAYGPMQILGSYTGKTDSMRFITAKKFSEVEVEDGESEIKFEYESFLIFSVAELEELYGKLGNFTHPTLKDNRERMAHAVVADCFSFYEKYQGIFRRHSLEANVENSDKPPESLSNLLFIVGKMENGKDVLWQCEKTGWVKRTPLPR